MIACDQEVLTAHVLLDQLVEPVKQAGSDGRRIDEVERRLFAQRLQMGLHLLQGFVAAAGDGDLGEIWEVPVAPPTTADGLGTSASQDAPASPGSSEAEPP